MTNTSNRCRIGLRKIGRRSVYSTNRSLTRYATWMLFGTPRPNHLAIAARCLETVIRLHKKWIKEMPECFDPNVIAQRQHETEQERFRKEVLTPALDKIYGTETIAPETGPAQK